MKETQLVTAIIKYPDMRNDVYAWKNHTGALVNDGRLLRYGKKGSADIIGAFNGWFLAIKAKVGKNKQSDFQEVFQARVEAVGGLYILAYSLDDVIGGLNG